MREIKFRAWDKLLQCYTRGSMGLFINSKGEITFDAGTRYIFQQYTGLKDKNGKEIFEGDWVRTANDSICSVVFGDYYNDECEEECENKCHGIGFYFKDKGGYYLLREAVKGSNGYEVIGNIYENPELLGAS